MDTEISYKYKDGYHNEIFSGHITLDKSVYKRFVGVYDTNFNDELNLLPRRLWNCYLMSSGDERCKAFLTDIRNFVELGEYFEKFYIWIMKQELVEVTFQLY